MPSTAGEQGIDRSRAAVQNLRDLIGRKGFVIVKVEDTGFFGWKRADQIENFIVFFISGCRIVSRIVGAHLLPPAAMVVLAQIDHHPVQPRFAVVSIVNA